MVPAGLWAAGRWAAAFVLQMTQPAPPSLKGGGAIVEWLRDETRGKPAGWSAQAASRPRCKLLLSSTVVAKSTTDPWTQLLLSARCVCSSLTSSSGLSILVQLLGATFCLFSSHSSGSSLRTFDTSFFSCSFRFFLPSSKRSGIARLSRNSTCLNSGNWVSRSLKVQYPFSNPMSSLRRNRNGVLCWRPKTWSLRKLKELPRMHTHRGCLVWCFSQRWLQWVCRKSAISRILNQSCFRVMIICNSATCPVCTQFRQCSFNISMPALHMEHENVKYRYSPWYRGLSSLAMQRGWNQSLHSTHCNAGSSGSIDSLQ
mmetsp:Transcript_66938/g.112032  ORF Transcript_66938/g.112032 Transcript_66938/m.112032 type:complete len:314 (+) Transcript_66938:890-1831(+)